MHCGPFGQQAPGGKGDVAEAGLGATIEVMSGKATAAAPTSRRNMPAKRGGLLTGFSSSLNCAS